MPYAGGTVTLVANTESANQLAGNIEEFVTRPSFVRLTAVISVVPVTSKFFIGRTVLINGQNVNNVGTSISLKDHVLVEHLGVRGRIFLTFTSTGTPTVLWRVDILPLK
jgi:hypothetical protein